MCNLENPRNQASTHNHLPTDQEQQNQICTIKPVQTITILNSVNDELWELTELEKYES